MVVKVVTDSGSDITPEEAKQLGIFLVPAYVRFGNEIYRDGVDIDIDGFYRKLATNKIHPSTAAPAPGDFAKVYEEAARESSEIISIHITRKHSAVYDAALLGKEIAEKKGCQVEVIDSQGVTIWQGLVAIAAAKAAEAGYGLQQVVDRVHEVIGQLRVLAVLDTLRYVVKGGRLGNTIFKVESLLNVKPLITLRNGEVRPAGVVRTWNKGVDRLHKFIASIPRVEDVAIAYSAAHHDAQTLADYVSSLFPGVVPRMVRLGPTLGVHAGPGALVVVMQEGKRFSACPGR